MILFVLVFVTSAIACNGGKNDKPSETQSIGQPSEESVASGGNAGQPSEEDKQSDGWFDIKL
mgnify:CR=1 FL=1